MIPAIIAAVVLLGGAGTTVVVADNAKPGDTLYGVDRAVENVRLSLAGEDSKNELKIRFAEERLEEVEELIEEASNDDDSDDFSDDSNDDNATSSDDSPDDDSELDEEEASNIEVGLQHALDLLSELNAEKVGNPGLGTAIERLLNNMNTQIIALPGNVDIRLDSNDLETDESGSVGRTEIKIDVKKDGETKIETRMNGERVRIEIDDDGEIDFRVQEDRRGSNSGEEDRLDSDMRGESRFRADDDEIEYESDPGFDMSGSGDEEEEVDKDIAKQLEDAKKALEKIQEDAMKDEKDDSEDELDEADDSDSSDSDNEEDKVEDTDGSSGKDEEDDSGSHSDADDKDDDSDKEEDAV